MELKAYPFLKINSVLKLVVSDPLRMEQRRRNMSGESSWRYNVLF